MAIDELDGVTEQPLAVVRVDGHLTLANRRGLQDSGALDVDGAEQHRVRIARKRKRRFGQRASRGVVGEPRGEEDVALLREVHAPSGLGAGR